MFYNGFNLLVDILLILVVSRVSFSSGWKSGYSERDGEITEDAERWGDYYYETQRENEREDKYNLW